MRTQLPTVSVVIATHDRPRRLAALLAALRAQRLVAGESFEVVVVDDGSGPATGAVLAAEANAGKLALRVVRHHHARGPGAARNAGWRVTVAPLVAFTDDDCLPTPAWLAAGLEAHRSEPAAVVQGRTLPNPAEAASSGVFSRTVRVDALGPHFETCNIFYPRALLEQLDGFDEHFGLAPGGEDTDLAWRAIELGLPTRFAADALVHHAIERLGPIGSLRVAARWSETVGVFARHPQLRRSLYRGTFWNVWHYLLLRSLVAFAMPARLHGLRRMLLGRHVAALRARARQADAGPWAVPYLLVHDAVELSAVARGAIRARTLVL